MTEIDTGNTKKFFEDKTSYSIPDFAILIKLYFIKLLMLIITIN